MELQEKLLLRFTDLCKDLQPKGPVDTNLVIKKIDNKIISCQKWVEINAISFLPVDDVLNLSSVEITKSLHSQRAREDW